MPRNGSGIFTREHDWTDDADNDINIDPIRMDEDTDDIADEITNSVAADGQTTMSGNLKMGNNRVTGLGNGTARTDAMTVGQAQDNGATYMTSTGSSNAYVLTPSPAITSYTEGQRFVFKANFANTGAATVNISGLGAKDIKKFVSTDLDANDILSGKLIDIRYDGTNFQINNSSIVEILGDTSPQLGGALDANGFAINMGDQNVNRPVLKDYAETLTTANSSTSYTIDLENGNVFNITLTGNCTFTFSNPPASGKAGAFTLILHQDGTGSRTVTWPASVDWDYAIAPTLTTTASTVDILTFMTIDGGTTWWGFVAGKKMS